MKKSNTVRFVEFPPPPFPPRNHIEYDCERGGMAQIIIPKEATQDDIQAVRELLEVLIRAKYKEAQR